MRGDAEQKHLEDELPIRRQILIIIIITLHYFMIIIAKIIIIIITLRNTECTPLALINIGVTTLLLGYA